MAPRPEYLSEFPETLGFSASATRRCPYPRRFKSSQQGGRVDQRYEEPPSMEDGAIDRDCKMRSAERAKVRRVISATG